jgi:hypothetical protein
LSAADALPRQVAPIKTSLRLAARNKSTQGPYDGIVDTSCNTQSAPGHLAGTSSRKDQHMQIEPTLTIEIVSDIV